MSERESSASLGSVRLLIIIERLTEEPQLGISDLAKEFGWSKGAVHRLLSALVKMDYAEQLPETKQYQLTSKLFELGCKAIDHAGVTDQALPVMQDLLAKAGETVNLAVLDRGDIVYVQKLVGPEPLRVDVKIGSRLPAHCSALGKVLLAELPANVLDDLLEDAELGQFTPNTITDKEALKQELGCIREGGFAIDREELSRGLWSIAAPIRDTSGSVAALSIAGPIGRLAVDRLDSLAGLVVEAASSISRKLGYVDRLHD